MIWHRNKSREKLVIIIEINVWIKLYTGLHKTMCWWFRNFKTRYVCKSISWPLVWNMVDFDPIHWFAAHCLAIKKWVDVIKRVCMGDTKRVLDNGINLKCNHLCTMLTQISISFHASLNRTMANKIKQPKINSVGHFWLSERFILSLSTTSYRNTANNTISWAYIA